MKEIEMALTTSLQEAQRMTDKVATEDIIETNENGQNVVIVAAGQRIPEGVAVPKAKSQPEDKAKRSSRESK